MMSLSYDVAGFPDVGTRLRRFEEPGLGQADRRRRRAWRSIRPPERYFLHQGGRGRSVRRRLLSKAVAGNRPPGTLPGHGKATPRRSADGCWNIRRGLRRWRRHAAGVGFGLGGRPRSKLVWRNLRKASIWSAGGLGNSLGRHFAVADLGGDMLPGIAIGGEGGQAGKKEGRY